MKQDCILFAWRVSHDSDACIYYRQRLPLDMPCIHEEEEFKHKDTSTEQLKFAKPHQSVQNEDS